MRKQNILAAWLLITTSMTLGSFSHAAWLDNILPVEQISTSVSCSNVSQIYLNQDNDSDGIPDFYLYLNSNFILNGGANSYTAGQILRESAWTQYTKIKYHTPLPNMIYKKDANDIVWPLDDTTFWRASRVFPYNTPVRWIATTPNKVVFEEPSDNDHNKNTINIVYDYRYKYAEWFDGTTSSAYRYNQVPSMWFMLNTGLTYFTTLPWSAGNRKRLWSAVQSIATIDTICRNYTIHRCGDGTLDTNSNGYTNTFTWEVCDDWALNWTPGHCPMWCGAPATNERCGDEILQPAGSYYNGNTSTMSFEECDDGDLAWDTNGVINWNDPATSFCSAICLPNFTEAFTEEFVNG